MLRPSGLAPGYAYDGGFGTHIHAPASDLVRVPDELSIKEATSATDAGMTSYHALFNRGKVEKGMKIALIGIGGLSLKLPDITFDEIPEGINRLHRGEVQGRLVAVYDES
ncbi:hypothetical protein [Salinicoccus roseus]|uniref:hypothetical protein n=1 Tax=Salinicoccus roseus TaxID=45670 RepID=UPI003D9FCA28